MCGIFGIVTSSGQQPNQKYLELGANSIKHRGPDDYGYYYASNLALGSRRLAILDLSKNGHQPMSYRKNTIVYNGEIYNYLEIKKQLKAKGYFFETQTDTEVVLAAYDYWGEECVNHFNGMWAFAIHNQQTNSLFCSRDRFGIKPFYYVLIEDVFYFASEIKAFLSLPTFKAILNESIAQDFLIDGIQHHSKATFYKDVFQLEAGHNLVYDLKKSNYKIKEYYSFDWSYQDSTLSFNEASEAFENLLNDSIRLHIRSDVKTGTALSGGLDSSAVLSLQYLQLAKVGKPDLEAINYTPEVEKYNEQKYIQDLLKKYPVQLHTTKKTFRALWATIDEVIKTQDEPILSGSLLAQYEVFRLAKEKGIKVMLDGQGADELLAGYGTYYPSFLKYILANKTSQLPTELFGLFRHHNIPLGKIKNRFKKPTSYHSFLKPDFFESRIENKNQHFQAYSIYMIQSGILPALLHFEDRNSMAHSVEARVPFLDYRLVEFCMSLPPEYKITKGIRKSLLRNGLKEVLPISILKRYDKLGFVSPQEEWMDANRTEFEEEVERIIKEYASIFNEHLIGFSKAVLRKKDRRHYAFLWRVMSLGRWMRGFDITRK